VSGIEEIRQKLVKFCLYRDRCHSEVEIKMKEFCIIPEVRDEIFLYLINEGYLSEERFTRSYIRGKFYMNHWGREKIKLNLKLKKIPEKLIDSCMSEVYEEDYIKQIHKFTEKLLPTFQELNEFQKKNKLIRFLISKGYEYDIILKQIEYFFD